jgi:hypothetical protein
LPRVALITARAVIVAATFAGSATARDVDCGAVPDVDARYRRILTVFERGQSAAKVWWFGWTGGYAAATVAQGVLAGVTSDRGTRIDSVVGATESAIGVIAMLVAVPRTPMWASNELLRMDDDTPCARLRRLRRAEALLEKSADEEAQARSWYTQLIGGAINLAAPVVLWVGYQRYASGWYTLAPGLAAQEGQILTQPTAALAAWNSYAEKYAKPRRASWVLAPLPGGAAVVGTF